jgi:hypothetical protein
MRYWRDGEASISLCVLAGVGQAAVFMSEITGQGDFLLAWPNVEETPDIAPDNDFSVTDMAI